MTPARPAQRPPRRPATPAASANAGPEAAVAAGPAAPPERRERAAGGGVRDSFGVPFSIREFCAAHHVPSMAEAERAIGVTAGSFTQWEGTFPLKVVKALVVRFASEAAAQYEQQLTGKIVRRRLPYRLSERVGELERDYDAMRQGVELRTTTGETLRIPVRPVAPLGTPPTDGTDATATLAPAIAAFGAPPDHGNGTGNGAGNGSATSHPDGGAAHPGLHPVMLPYQLAAAVAGGLLGGAAHANGNGNGHGPPGETTGSAGVSIAMMEVPTPFGVMHLPVPTPMAPGEREIYTNLILRLNHELIQERVRSARFQAELQAAEGRVQMLQRRMKELVDENKTKGDLIEKAGRDAAARVETLTTPQAATTEDFGRVKQSLAQVPELVRMVEGMQQGFRVGPSRA